MFYATTDCECGKICQIELQGIASSCLTVLCVKVQDFRDMKPCRFERFFLDYHEDGGSKILRNAGNCLPVDMVSHPKRTFIIAAVGTSNLRILYKLVTGCVSKFSCLAPVVFHFCPSD